MTLKNILKKIKIVFGEPLFVRLEWMEENLLQ